MAPARPARDGRAAAFGALLCAGALLAAVAPAFACGTRSPDGGPTFPPQLRPGARYLSDAAGKPLFLQGDTAWSLIADLTREDADLYLRDRRARGFNTVLVSLIEHRFATNAPANAYGDQPFRRPGDFATPNDRYFDHAEWVLRRACDLGFLVLLTPSYAGYGGGPEGWYGEMQTSGADKLERYGRYLGTRLGDLRNIIWVQGGDYDIPDKTLVQALVDGIDATAPDAIHTVHGSPESAPLDYWGAAPWLAVNNVYTYEHVYDAALREYRRDAPMPFFLLESAYENEHEAGEHRLRAQAYHAILSGAMGHLFGNNPIWHFGAPGLYPVAATWQDQLDSPGARSMTVLNDLIRSIDWWLLEPDLDGALLVEGQGAAAARAVAARASDGSFALAYLPTRRPIEVDLGRLAGAEIAAHWFDPTSGQRLEIEGSPFPPTLRRFQPEYRNQAGFRDWVLVLTADPSAEHGR